MEIMVNLKLRILPSASIKNRANPCILPIETIVYQMVTGFLVLRVQLKEFTAICFLGSKFWFEVQGDS